MAKVTINNNEGVTVKINKTGKTSGINRIDTPLRVVKTLSAWSGDPQTNLQRMPAICVLNNRQAIILFCQRNENELLTDARGMRLVSRLVSFDRNSRQITVGETQVIDQPSDWEEGLGLSNHPQLIKMTVGPNAGRIVLLHNRNINDTGMGSVIYSVYRRYSDDDGVTWSEAEEVVAGSAGNYQANSGNGDMVQILSGTNAGRLVSPLYTPSAKYALLSDDYGETWYKSEAITTAGASSEPAISLCSDGETLIMTIRNDVSGDSARYQTKSTDGGVNWSTPVKVDSLVAPRCNASMTYDGEKLIMSGPSHSTNRIKGMLRLSYDDGDTWVDGYAPAPNNQNYGYSSVRRLSDEFLIVAFESNSRANLGFNLDEHIKVVVINDISIMEYMNPQVLPIASEAQQYYNQYEQRVMSDGGAITDPVATFDAIQFALNNRMQNGVPVAISARWGVKESSGNIEKLYSLFDSNGDVVSTGNGNDFFKINNDLSYARIAAPTAITTKHLQSSSFRALIGDKFGIGLSMVMPQGNDNARLGLNDDTTSSIAWQITNTGSGLVTVDVRDSDGLQTGFKLMKSYTDNAPMVFVADPNGGVIYLYVDGEQIITSGSFIAVTPASGGLYDFKTINTEFLIGARRSSGSTIGGRNIIYNEIWWLNNITDRQASALSERLMFYNV